MVQIDPDLIGHKGKNVVHVHMTNVIVQEVLTTQTMTEMTTSKTDLVDQLHIHSKTSHTTPTEAILHPHTTHTP
jgi:hypothetical protein